MSSLEIGFSNTNLSLQESLYKLITRFAIFRLLRLLIKIFCTPTILYFKCYDTKWWTKWSFSYSFFHSLVYWVFVMSFGIHEDWTLSTIPINLLVECLLFLLSTIVYGDWRVVPHLSCGSQFWGAEGAQNFFSWKWRQLLSLTYLLAISFLLSPRQWKLSNPPLSLFTLFSQSSHVGRIGSHLYTIIWGADSKYFLWEAITWLKCYLWAQHFPHLMNGWVYQVICLLSWVPVESQG